VTGYYVFLGIVALALFGVLYPALHKGDRP
jgi:hypothetical protein